MRGLSDLPLRLRWYLLVIIIAGLARAAAMAETPPFHITTPELWRASLLVLLAAGAGRLQFHLTYKTAISVNPVAQLAMVLVFPPGLAPLLTAAMDPARPRQALLDGAGRQ